MAARKRISTRKLEDLPSLFDEVPEAPRTPEADIIAAHRERQFTPATPITADMAINPADLCRYRELRFISFGSGSCGNCAYLGIPGEGGVLIDAGIDEATITKGLSDNCIPLSQISGILVTHDHADHVRGVYSLLRHNRHMVIYCTPKTLTGMLRRHGISRRLQDYHKPIFKEFEYPIGPFTVTPFETSHDGSDNVGYSIACGPYRFVVATDMGLITERADHYMRQANMLVVESNYDSDMLRRGRYPEHLKARIRGERGHMDNSATASYLAEIWRPELTHIYLCHLSHDNNTPDLALAATTAALQARGVTVGDASGSPLALGAQVQLAALPRGKSSPLFVHRLPRT